MFTALGASKRFIHAAIAFGLALMNAVVGIRDVLLDGRTDNLTWYLLFTAILVAVGLLFVRAGLRDLREAADTDPAWMRPGTGDPEAGRRASPGTGPHDVA